MARDAGGKCWGGQGMHADGETASSGRYQS
jgi:hypothetical protein